MSGLHLERCNDGDFEWLLGERSPSRDLRIAPKLAPAEVLQIVRRLAVSWLIVDAGEVVGLISLHRPIANGEAEIGYGIAPWRQRQGRATRAVAALIDLLREEGLRALTAETSVGNPASQRALERNRFEKVGTRDDEEDGPVIQWRVSLTSKRAPDNCRSALLQSDALTASSPSSSGARHARFDRDRVAPGCRAIVAEG